MSNRAPTLPHLRLHAFEPAVAPPLPNVVALVALLHAKRFEDLTRFLEAYQKAFEQDFRKEFWLITAVDAFAAADTVTGELIDAWVAATPASFAPYLARASHRFVYLTSLEPRWGGSFDLMRAFALGAAGLAKENPRLGALAAFPDVAVCNAAQVEDDLTKAREACARAEAIAPHWRIVLGEKVDLLLASDNPDRAALRAAADKMLLLARFDVDARVDHAQAMIELERWEDAAADFKVALQIDPTDDDAIEEFREFGGDIGRGARRLWERGKRGAALALLDSAKRLGATGPEIRCWRELIGAYPKNNDDPVIANIMWTCHEPNKIDHFLRLDQRLFRLRRFAEIVRH